MINSTVMPMPQTTSVTSRNSIGYQTQVQASQMNHEQSMLVDYDISAEYSAISKMNNIIGDIAKELKAEKDPERKKLLEARINTLNSMIQQREIRLQQMENIRQQLESISRN